MAKVLIAGGAGFIGSYLTNDLRDRGHDVLVLDAFRAYAVPGEKRDRDLRDDLLAGSEIEIIDLVNNRHLMSCFARYQPEVVFNLTANPIVSAANLDPTGCEYDIVETTRSLVSAIEETDCAKRVVHISSSMVYGNFSAALVNEESITEPINAYGRMKLAAEELILELKARQKVETVIVRPMAVYGPGDGYNRVIPVFCARALAGLPLTVQATADVMIDFSYVEDIVDGMVSAAFEPAAAGETFNLSYGQSRSLLDVVAALQLHFPELRYEVVSKDDPTRPVRGTLDVTKARCLLDFKPSTTLEVGIGRCIEFLRKSQRDYSSSGMVPAE